MSRGRDIELPAEALALIEQVRSLEKHAEKVRAAVTGDLVGIVKNAETERAQAAEGVVAAQRDVEAAKREIAQSEAEARERLAAERRQVTEQHALVKRDLDALEALLESRVRGFDLIGDAWADYEQARAEQAATELTLKDHPAFSAAEAVRQKGSELSAAKRELKRSQWALRLYEWHFPWLTELRDLEEEQSFVSADADEPDDELSADPAQRWLSKAEYGALTEAQRNQQALDRYSRSRKTPWQLGRDYERYVGYLREASGARVTYQGIFAGLEDLGRDLIVERGDAIEVVQCKRWSQHKTIHEKHIFQLFGTVVAARIEYPDREVTGTFTTTTTLSERAHKFAAQLGIHVEEGFPLGEYPRIKCNIGRDGERIYHLPFDQQYDRAQIGNVEGEAWVATVAEAEALGFRRAWRWRGRSAGEAGRPG